MEMKSLIAIKNFGRTTRVLIGGIDLSVGIRKIEYQHVSGDNPEIDIQWDIEKLLKRLRELKAEEVENAVESIRPYVDDSALFHVLRSQVEEAQNGDLSESIGEGNGLL